MKRTATPMDLGSKLFGALLDISKEGYADFAWELFENLPDVKDSMKEMKKLTADLPEETREAIDTLIADIHGQANQFYLLMGYLVAQGYNLHRGKAVLQELEWLKAKVLERNVFLAYPREWGGGIGGQGTGADPGELAPGRNGAAEDQGAAGI